MNERETLLFQTEMYNQVLIQMCFKACMLSKTTMYVAF